jgi:hypothetical protein
MNRRLPCTTKPSVSFILFLDPWMRGSTSKSSTRCTVSSQSVTQSGPSSTGNAVKRHPLVDGHALALNLYQLHQDALGRGAVALEAEPDFTEHIRYRSAADAVQPLEAPRFELTRA